MRLTRSFQNSTDAEADIDQRGFTLLEFTVAMFISTGIFALITFTLMFQSDTYLNDISRTRIQQNLRSALDVVSMNVRQAGEGLDENFPAFLLRTAPTALTLRRKVVHEVLDACQDVAVADTQIQVSDHTTTGSRCLPVNIAPAVTSWTSYRTSHAGSAKIFIYNRLTKLGEFLNYTAESVSGGDNFITVGPVANDYPAVSTSIYVLEEYLFQLHTPTNTLEVLLNGEVLTPQDVAYKVVQFDALLTMKDASTLTALAATDVTSWKDIRKVKITLRGEEAWKSQTFSRTVSGEYFPRNVLSH